MKYEVYIDAFFLLNFFMDVLLLALVKLVLQCTATHFRLIMGAAFGAGAVSILTIMPILPVWFKLFAGYGIISIWMLKISFRQLRFLQACTAAVYLYGFAFLLGGALHFFMAQFSFLKTYGTDMLFIFAVAAFTYGIFSLLYAKKREKRKDCLFHVTLLWRDREKKLLALMDTGNSLYEPISGRAVSVLEKSAAASLFPAEQPDFFRAIPFHSVGKAHGILEGYELTALIIEGEYEDIRIEKPIVGLLDGKVSADGTYQMILHPALTQKNRRKAYDI